MGVGVGWGGERTDARRAAPRLSRRPAHVSVLPPSLPPCLPARPVPSRSRLPAGPTLPARINEGLLALLARDGFDNVAQAVGADVKGVAPRKA